MPKADTQFKKGDKGGPGRPKGTGRPTFNTIVERLKARKGKPVQMQHEDWGVIDDPYEQAVMMLISAAQNGEPWAIKELIEHGMGKARQTIDQNITTPTELANEIREALENGGKAKIADLCRRLKVRPDGAESGDNGADSK